MHRNEIEEKVGKVFQEAFEVSPERLVPDAHIFNDLGLDSLDMIDLVLEMQQSFGVKIKDETAIRNVRTLEDLYVFINKVEEELKKS